MNFLLLAQPASSLDPSHLPHHLQCTEGEVSDLIVGLDASKSSRLDGISARMLKATAWSIALSVTT